MTQSYWQFLLSTQKLTPLKSISTSTSAPGGGVLSGSISSASAVGMSFPPYGFPTAGYPGHSYEKVNLKHETAFLLGFQSGYPFLGADGLSSYSTVSTADSTTSNTSPHLPYASSYPYQAVPGTYPVGSSGSMPFNSPFSQYGQPSPGATGLGKGD